MITLQDYLLHIADEDITDIDDSFDEQVANLRRTECLFDILKRAIHDDKFVSMSTEAQLLYMYLILDSGTGKDRPRALCRMLFHDGKDPLKLTPRVYPYEAYDELCKTGFISREEED